MSKGVLFGRFSARVPRFSVLLGTWDMGNSVDTSLFFPRSANLYLMTDALIKHEKLVAKAVAWLRRYRCGVVLSEQSCSSGETPDAIGWKRASHSVIVECKISRADFLADREKPFRRKPEIGMGCERYYLTLAELLKPDELPSGWGLLELRGREVHRVFPV